MGKLLRGVLVALALSGTAAAGPLEDGRAANDRGDYATALRFWRPLADQGDANAQLSVGRAYELGRGVARHYVEAVRWYRRSAEQGNARARSNLGYMYDVGHGVEEDPAEAVRWYRLSAEQGNAFGQRNLGRMYAIGRGVPQSLVQAHMWLELAAFRFEPGADRDDAVRRRQRISARMTPAQIAEARRLASEWEVGHPPRSTN
jgi:TPR repeat protein